MSNNSLTLETIWSFNASGAYESNLQSSNSKFKDIFKPAMGKINGKRYSALLKFLPYANNIDKSIICKRELYLLNPNTSQGRTIDVPMLVSGVKNIFFTAYNLCDKAESGRIRDLKQHFSSYTQYFSLIQIIDDEINPDLNNQVKIFKYGDTIHKKVKEVKNPSTKHKEPNDIFDLKNGKLFQLNITKNPSNPNQGNYDTCEFLDKTSFPIIDGIQCKKPERILKFLTEEVPELLEHEYKEWDSTTIKYVADCIYKIFPRDCHELDVIITEFPEIMSSSTGGYAYDVEEEERPVQKNKTTTSSIEEVVNNESKKTEKQQESSNKTSKIIEDNEEDENLEDFMDEEKAKISKKDSKVNVDKEVSHSKKSVKKDSDEEEGVFDLDDFDAMLGDE